MNLFSRTKRSIYLLSLAFSIALIGSYAPVQATTVKLAVDSTNSQVQALKGQMNSELSRRISNIEQGAQSIQDSTAFSADTKAKLQKTNTDTLNQLQSLQKSTNSASTLDQAQSLATSIDGQYNQYQIANGQAAITGDVSSQQQAQKQLTTTLQQAQSQLSSYCNSSSSSSNNGTSSSSSSSASSLTVQVGGSDVSVCGGANSSSNSSSSSSGSSDSSGGSGLQQIITQLMQLAVFVASIIASVIALVTAIQSGNTAGALTAALALMTTIMGQLGIADSTLTQAVETATSVVNALNTIQH